MTYYVGSVMKAGIYIQRFDDIDEAMKYVAAISEHPISDSVRGFYLRKGRRRFLNRKMLSYDFDEDVLKVLREKEDNERRKNRPRYEGSI